MAFLIAYLSGEFVALFVFGIIRHRFAAKGTKLNVAIVKGLIERLAVLLGLAANIQSIITFFGAIKIGTRLKDANENRVSNDYFLFGNFVSITIVLLEFYLYSLLMAQPKWV